MFGSLGWGLAMFFVGIALDHSTAFPGHPCGPHEKERNYTICFAVFSVLMGCALITASQFKVSKKVEVLEMCAYVSVFFFVCENNLEFSNTEMYVFVSVSASVYTSTVTCAHTTYDTYLSFTHP